MDTNRLMPNPHISKPDPGQAPYSNGNSPFVLFQRTARTSWKYQEIVCFNSSQAAIDPGEILSSDPSASIPVVHWRHRRAHCPRYRRGRGHRPGDDRRYWSRVMPNCLTVPSAHKEQANEESQAEECYPGGCGDVQSVSHIDFRVSRVTAASLYEYLVISQGRR